MYPKLKINVYFIFLNIGDLTFGITLVLMTDLGTPFKVEILLTLILAFGLAHDPSSPKD
jgi:hypothetical protein